MSCECSAGCVLQCGSAYRCVSNSSGAWVVMVLLGAGVGFGARYLLCDEEHNIALEGALKLQAYSQLHMKIQGGTSR